MKQIALIGVIAALILPGLSACGKKAPLRPPSSDRPAEDEGGAQINAASDRATPAATRRRGP